MSNSIYQKIEEKGIQEANKIKQEGLLKANDLKNSLIEDKRKELDINLLSVKNKLEDSLKKKVTDLELEYKKENLTSKKELINSVFNKIVDVLLKLDDDKFTELVVKLIKSTLLEGNETIIVSSFEYDRFRKLFCNKDNDLAKLNKLLGSNYHLTLSQDKANFKGGFVIVSSNYDVDFSYCTLLSDLEEKLETEIANVLFC